MKIPRNSGKMKALREVYFNTIDVGCVCVCVCVCMQYKQSGALA